MQLNSGVVIYFVQEAASSNKEMRKAFLACQDLKLKPKTITEEQVDEVPQGTNVVFVLEEFGGSIFKSLTASDCFSRVVGPRCLEYCLRHEVAIPSNDSSIFNMAMKGLIVTSSRFPKQKKEEIATLVGYMGGSYTDQLTAAVTHLVSDEGRSPKCDKAVEKNIPIMTSEWVKAVWEVTKMQDVTALDSAFKKYKMPPFRGMNISCSNLSQAIKKKIQAAVESNGGVYMTALEQNKTTALIIGEPSGKKFQAAQLWGIPCLQTEWIFDSAEKGMALHSKDYLISARPKCSTPTPATELPSFMSNDVSCIPFGGDSANNTINETNSTMNSMLFKDQPNKNVKPQPMKPHMHEYKKLINEINSADAAAAGLFLDGCKVFLSGFNLQELDKMKKLINRSGATLFPEISDRLSHVIMGEFLPDQVKEIEKLAEKPHVVSVEWILASIRLKTAAPTEPYLCFKSNVNKNAPVAPASPLSHKGLSLLKSNAVAETPKNDSPQEALPTSRKLFVKAPVQKRQLDSPESECLPVLKTSDVSASKPSNAPPPSDAVLPDITPKAIAPAQAPTAETPGPSANDTNSCNSSSIDIGPIFQGMVFLVIGFDDPTTIIESIFAVGGKVESSHFQGVADFAVLPLNGVSTQLTATEVVTPLWVEDCYEQTKVVPVDYFHQPVALKAGVTPLEGCVICVSGYVGKERTFIVHLAGALGATVQELFSRKDHPAKKIFKSTHLVCKAPAGSKYNAAMKWGVPVVSQSWLLACVSSGTLAPVESHQFSDKGVVPQTPQNPAIQRLKATETDASSTIIGTTPCRGSTSPAHVNETTRKDETPTAKSGETFIRPADVSVSNKRPASPGLDLLKSDGKNETKNCDVSTKATITPRTSLTNDGTTVDGFITPGNLRRLSNVGSTGKTSLLNETPNSPYGRVFMEEGGNPSPATRKYWKRFIDNLPDLYEGSPEVQEFRKRRPSTPLSVVMKQCMVKFGGAEIEGIEPDTGNLLADGPFAEWAHENSASDGPDHQRSKGQESNKKDGNAMNSDSISKELSNLKSRLNSVLTPSQQKEADGDLTTPGSSNQGNDEACNTKAGSWITPKGIEKPSVPAEIQWDFGKPTISVKRPLEPVTKKLRMSNDEDDKISEQVNKLYENDKPEEPKKDRKIFVLSQMSPDSREKFEGIIKNLGGEVSTSTCFEPRTTHLVVDRILRSEKLLCAVASGKWVLHSSYLTQCYQSRMFLPEEDYEWGNERSRNRLPTVTPGTTEWDLARAVHKWRVRRTDLGQPDAFRSFKAVILTSDNKIGQYMRLLEAGNATVLPKQRITEATHVFWDEDKVPLPVDKSVLKSHKIPLLKPVYLGDYLAKSPPPNVEDYTIR